MLTETHTKARGLADLPPVQEDSLLALIALCNADPRPDKIDVGVGVFRDAVRWRSWRCRFAPWLLPQPDGRGSQRRAMARGHARCGGPRADPVRRHRLSGLWARPG